MVKPVAGTSQWRKLIFSKEQTDQGTIWRISTWKVAGLLIAILLFFIFSYSFFVKNQTGYLSDVLFYGILLTVIILVLWLLSNLVWKSRKFIAWFLISLILIAIFYAVIGYALSFIGWKFNYGFVVWIIITTFAMIAGAMKNDELDRKDVLFGLLVFVVLIGANAPAFGGSGFFAKIDDFINLVRSWLSNFIKI